MGEFAEGRRDQHLALLLEGPHAAAIGLRRAADQDHRPAILLRIGEAGEAVHDAGAGHDDAGAGAAIAPTGTPAVGRRSDGGFIHPTLASSRPEFLLDHGAQWRQGQLYGVPYAWGGYILIIMAVDVSGAGHLSPGNAGMPCLEVIAQTARASEISPGNA